MVARKWVRLAQAVAAELDGTSDIHSLSQAPDDVLLRASERCGLLLAAQFHRPEDRLAAIRRRLDDVRGGAESYAASSSDEDDDASIRRQLRAIALRDTTNMGPTDRRTTAEALRTLAVLNRASRKRGDLEKRESEMVQRPAKFNVEPVMRPRSILPAGPTPQELAERAAHAARVAPPLTLGERLQQQALADQARMLARYERQMHEALRWISRRPRDDEDMPRRIGMPGLGGM